MSAVISGCQDLGVREGIVLSSSGTRDADNDTTMHKTVPRNKAQKVNSTKLRNPLTS